MVSRLALVAVLVAGVPAQGTSVRSSPTVVHMATLAGLRYEFTRFCVKPGVKVELVVENRAALMHNLVFTRPGARAKVVAQAAKLGVDAAALGFVPESDDVLWSLGGIKPGATRRLRFTTPNTSGDYPYVSTYPGHGAVMFGTMVVTEDPQPPVKSVLAPADGLAARRAREVAGAYVRQTPGGYTVTDDGKLVLVYNRDPISRPGGDHQRGHYIHPLFGLDGQRMTDDMPADHLHHRGLFWAWSQLWIGDRRIGQPWEQKDLSWDVTDVEISNRDGTAELRTQVSWKSPLWVDARQRQRPIVDEVSVIRVHPVRSDARAIDFEISLRARTADVRLGGSTNAKGYGGFSVRIPLPEDLRIQGPDGKLSPDLRRPTRATPWVDFSGTFGGASGPSGLTILCHPRTPGYPQGWTIRRRNSCQNPVYPGQHPVVVPMDRPIVLRYRVVLHRSGFDAARMQRFFAEYQK